MKKGEIFATVLVSLVILGFAVAMAYGKGYSAGIDDGKVERDKLELKATSEEREVRYLRYEVEHWREIARPLLANRGLNPMTPTPAQFEIALNPCVVPYGVELDVPKTCYDLPDFGRRAQPPVRVVLNEALIEHIKR